MFSGILSLILPEGEENSCPDTAESEDILRGRTVDNVLEISGSADIIIEGITFWASNIIAIAPVKSRFASASPLSTIVPRSELGHGLQYWWSKKDLSDHLELGHLAAVMRLSW